MTYDRQPLEEHELEELLEAASLHSTTTEFIVRALARTGMRAAELAHMRVGWVEGDWDLIRLQHTDCRCGDCRQKASESEDRTLDDYWLPKSEAGARPIPVSQEHGRFREVMADFFADRDRVGMSRQNVWYHCNKLNDEVSFDKPVLPHVLRHTFGTLAAYNGAEQAYIQDVMGHEDPSSSKAYIKMSGRQVSEMHEQVWG